MDIHKICFETVRTYLKRLTSHKTVVENFADAHFPPVIHSDVHAARCNKVTSLFVSNMSARWSSLSQRRHEPLWSDTELGFGGQVHISLLKNSRYIRA